MSVQDLLATHDCAVPGCPDEARERGGVCAYHARGDRPAIVAPGSHAHLMEDTPDPARAERQAIAVVDELLGPPDIKEEPVAAPVSREIVVERIRAYHLEHGRIPTRREEPSLSRAATVAFGTWGGAVEAAGFPRPKRGAKRRSSDSASSSEAKKPEAAARPTPPPAETEGRGAPEDRTTNRHHDARGSRPARRGHTPRGRRRPHNPLRRERRPTGSSSRDGRRRVTTAGYNPAEARS